MSEYLQFYFAIDEDEIEQHDSVLTNRSDVFARIEFVRRCYDSYRKKDQNIGKAFDEEGYVYNYVAEGEKVFRTREPDPLLLKYIEENSNNESESLYGF